MKKLALYLLGFFRFCLTLANEDTTVPNYNYAGRPIGTDVAENQYSVEKQYAKADQIKQGNRFYNLKKSDEVAMVGDTEDKYYSLVDIYKLAAEHNADYQAARSTFAANVETVPTTLGALLPQVDFNYNLRKDLYNQFGIIESMTLQMW